MHAEMFYLTLSTVWVLPHSNIFDIFILDLLDFFLLLDYFCN